MAGKRIDKEAGNVMMAQDMAASAALVDDRASSAQLRICRSGVQMDFMALMCPPQDSQAVYAF